MVKILGFVVFLVASVISGVWEVLRVEAEFYEVDKGVDSEDKVGWDPFQKQPYYQHSELQVPSRLDLVSAHAWSIQLNDESHRPFQRQSPGPPIHKQLSMEWVGWLLGLKHVWYWYTFEFIYDYTGCKRILGIKMLSWGKERAAYLE